MTIAEPFYTAILREFDIDRVYSDHRDITMVKVVGYGKGDDEALCLFETSASQSHGKGTHLAFNAPSRDAVDVSLSRLSGKHNWNAHQQLFSSGSTMQLWLTGERGTAPRGSGQMSARTTTAALCSTRLDIV